MVLCDLLTLSVTVFIRSAFHDMHIIFHVHVYGGKMITDVLYKYSYTLFHQPASERKATASRYFVWAILYEKMALILFFVSQRTHTDP